VSEPIKFLTALGHALAAGSLYSAGHPARERAAGHAWEQLEQLCRFDPAPVFSFVDEEILYRQQALRDLKVWDWGKRLAKIGVERIEFEREVSFDDLREFLTEMQRRLAQGEPDTSEARQLQPSRIRFGTLSLRGADSGGTVVPVASSEALPYTLEDEIATVAWMHGEVESTSTIPMAEAEAVVRSLALAMHSQSRMLMPLLQLRSYDQYTTTHATNVAVLSMALAEYLGLTRRDVREIGVAGLLHDLGKVRVPRDILNRPGALTEAEMVILRRHPVDGARLIMARETKLEMAATVAYEHHIMLNGQGYPSFRYGRDTHYASKLIHVCDVYDALCTNRPYRDAWEPEQAVAYLEERAGQDFEPDLAESFTTMMRQWTHQRVLVSGRVSDPPS
jgi:putative nucleotidyltransferase with HDIG domain